MCNYRIIFILAFGIKSSLYRPCICTQLVNPSGEGLARVICAGTQSLVSAATFVSETSILGTIYVSKQGK